MPFDVELAGELDPYQPPGIGIALRGDSLIVDQVLEGSAAAKADLRTKDLIRSFGGMDIEDNRDLHTKLASARIGETVEVVVERDGELIKEKLAIQGRSAQPFSSQKNRVTREARIFEIKVADAANKCFAMVPSNTDEETSPALLVWISSPGKLDKKALEQRWLSQCKKHNVAILFPESTDEKRWSPDDASIIFNAIENLNKQSPFDSKRVTIGGVKAGGTMASLITFGRRDLFQGLAMIDAKPSTKISRMETSPVQPLLVFAGTSQVAPDLQNSLDELEAAHFPVFLKEQKGGLSVWIEMLLPWSETVNRL